MASHLQFPHISTRVISSSQTVALLSIATTRVPLFSVTSTRLAIHNSAQPFCFVTTPHVSRKLPGVGSPSTHQKISLPSNCRRINPVSSSSPSQLLTQHTLTQNTRGRGSSHTAHWASTHEHYWGTKVIYSKVSWYADLPASSPVTVNSYPSGAGRSPRPGGLSLLWGDALRWREFAGWGATKFG